MVRSLGPRVALGCASRWRTATQRYRTAPIRCHRAKRQGSASADALLLVRGATIGLGPTRSGSDCRVWQLAVLCLYLAGPVAGLAVAVVLASAMGLRPTWLDTGLAVLFY